MEAHAEMMTLCPKFLLPAFSSWFILKYCIKTGNYANFHFQCTRFFVKKNILRPPLFRPNSAQDFLKSLNSFLAAALNAAFVVLLLCPMTLAVAGLPWDVLVFCRLGL